MVLLRRQVRRLACTPELPNWLVLLQRHEAASVVLLRQQAPWLVSRSRAAYVAGATAGYCGSKCADLLALPSCRPGWCYCGGHKRLDRLALTKLPTWCHCSSKCAPTWLLALLPATAAASAPTS